MHLHAVRGMQDDAPVSDLVARTFDGEGAIGRKRPGRLPLLGEVGEEILLRMRVEARGIEACGRLLGSCRGHFAGELSQGLAELGRAPDPVAVPERQLARLPECGHDVDAVVGDLDDAPARRAQGEDVVDARLVDHLLVEFTHAGVAALAGDEHSEQASVGDSSTAGDRDPLRSGATGERALVTIPDQPRPEFGELVGRESPCQKVERGLVGGAGKGAERGAALYRLKPALHVDRPERARGDRLLREDVERILGHGDRLDLAGEHPLGDDRGVQHVAAVLREQRGPAHLAHLVTRTPDPLQAGCRRRGSLDLDHQVDRAHVDTELQARGRDHAPQHARLQLLLDLGALLLRHRAVMGLGEDGGRACRRPGLRHHRGGHRRVGHIDSDALGVDLVQSSRQPLRQAAGIGEDDRRAVGEDAVDDGLLHVRPQRPRPLLRSGVGRIPIAGRVAAVILLRRCARGWRRIEHVFDRHHDAKVERLRGSWRDDLDRLRTAEEARDFVDGAHGGRQADPLRGRGVGIVGASQRIEALQADREMRAALGGGDGVHLVDDHRVHFAQGLARLAGEHQIERLGSGDEDVGGIGHQLPPVARRGVARPHTDGDVRHGLAEAPPRLADADQG